jgi:DNA-binding response OmpR family regulator
MDSETVRPPAQVLVIDDEPETVRIVQQALEEADFKVHTATSPVDGLALYEQHWRDIDLVLLDYLMPEMTGDVAFECLQQIDPDARVMLLTGCDDHVASILLDKGLRGCISKPFYLDELVNRVREEIEKG